MTTSTRKVTGWLFLIGALAFGGAATVLSSTFDWPDILREPASVVLPEYAAGGDSLTWTWFAVAWTYAISLVPILLLPAALGRGQDVALRTASWIGAAGVVLSVAGFLRWVFVVPPLARSYVSGDEMTKKAVDAAWTAQHQYGGALLGEHLGEIMAIGWSATVCVLILRHKFLPAALAWTGLFFSGFYFLAQGDIMRTALPDFPVLELAGLVGSTGWGLWVAALGVVLLVKKPVDSAP